MKLAFVHGPDDLRVDEVDAPVCGPRDVVLRVGSCGICGSDLTYTAAGGIPGLTAGPMPLGHELAGTVAEIGAEVKTVAPGDRVILNPFYNGIGNGGPEGGFAELLLVRDVVANPGALMIMPAGMSFDTAALAEPLCVSLHALNRGGACADDKVAVFGAGPIGLGAVAALRQRGIQQIVVFEPSVFRRQRAIEMGAEAAIDPRDEVPAAALRRLHGTTTLWGRETVGTNLFLDMAGAPGVVEGIVTMAPLGSRIIVTAVYKQPLTLDLNQFLAKELSLLAAMGYPSEFDEVLRLMESVNLEPMVSHRFQGGEFMQAFSTARQANVAAKVLVQYDR
jgi:2-desacetyl-2-hydroxyethyl bacteriochlorophyllide A dehydrogenase